MKKFFWMLFMLCSHGVVQATDNAQIVVSGKLVTPPCSPGFGTSLNISLDKVNVRQLLDGSAAVTEVPLTFTCRANSRVSLLLLPAGLGSVDNQTLLTSREDLGLRLVGAGGSPGLILGQTSEWRSGSEPLTLTLRFKPVMLEALPQAGSFTTTLLMQILYL